MPDSFSHILYASACMASLPKRKFCTLQMWFMHLHSGKLQKCHRSQRLQIRS